QRHGRSRQLVENKKLHLGADARWADAELGRETAFVDVASEGVEHRARNSGHDAGRNSASANRSAASVNQRSISRSADAHSASTDSRSYLQLISVMIDSPSRNVTGGIPGMCTTCEPIASRCIS